MTVWVVYGLVVPAMIVAAAWVDYLHMARFDGRWVIVNVLWELVPED